MTAHSATSLYNNHIITLYMGCGSVNGVGVVLCKSPLHRIVQEKIVMFKHTFFKTIGGGMLSWMELCAVVLEIEIQLN